MNTSSNIFEYYQGSILLSFIVLDKDSIKKELLALRLFFAYLFL